MTRRIFTKRYLMVECQAFDGTQSGTQNIQEIISSLIKNNNKITRKQLSIEHNIPVRTLQRLLNEIPNLKYVGSGKSGHWEITE